jgi:hypothetical protein
MELLPDLTAALKDCRMVEEVPGLPEALQKFLTYLGPNAQYTQDYVDRRGMVTHLLDTMMRRDQRQQQRSLSGNDERILAVLLETTRPLNMREIADRDSRIGYDTVRQRMRGLLKDEYVRKVQGKYALTARGRKV